MIVLVVDSKTRDLPSLCLLANQILSISNYRVVLCNFYELDEIMYLYRKEIKGILFSYVRIDNKKKIFYAKKNGFKILVYDQEGANGFDCLGIAKSWSENKLLLKYVDHYFFWGSGQKKKCLSIIPKAFHPKKNTTVGYIRSEININNVDIKNKYKKFILLNTNFAFCSPKFSTPKQELEAVKKINLYNGQEEKFSRLMSFRKEQFHQICITILEKHKDKLFILRPHPYEKIEEWENISKKYKNLKVETNYSSVDWIKACKMLIHIDCITSLESISLNKPSISLAWLINKSNLCYKVLADASYKAKNIKDLNSKINFYYKCNSNFKQTINKNVKKFFGNFDGKSSYTLAKEIIKSCKNNKKKRNFKEFHPFTFKIKIFLKKYFKNIFFIIYYLYSDKKIFYKYKMKKFDKNLVQKYLTNNTVIKSQIDSSFLIEKKINFF